MKRYKINFAYKVNDAASKKGYKWEYRGKTNDADEVIAEFEKDIPGKLEEIKNGVLHVGSVGLRVTDTESGNVVYEKVIC